MSSVKIRIRSKVFPPTGPMKKAGIKGKASVRIFVGELCLVELNNLLLRKRRKDGKLFLAPPQETWEDGNGDTQYFQLYRIAPDEKYDDETGFRHQFDTKVMGAFRKAMGKTEEEPKPKPKPEPQGTWGDDDDDEKEATPAAKNDDFSSDDDDEGDWI